MGGKTRDAVQKALDDATVASIIGAFSYRERQLLEFCDRTLAPLGEAPAPGE